MVVSHGGGSQGRIQSPSAETLCQGGSRWYLGGDPVVVGVAGVEAVVEGLHEAVELRAEARRLAEVTRCVDQVPFAFAPFSATIFEPNLKGATK